MDIWRDLSDSIIDIHNRVGYLKFTAVEKEGEQQSKGYASTNGRTSYKVSLDEEEEVCTYEQIDDLEKEIDGRTYYHMTIYRQEKSRDMLCSTPNTILW